MPLVNDSAAPVDARAFEAAIRSACTQFAAAYARGDFEGLAALYYTPDATMFAPGAPPLTGHTAIAGALAGLKASGVESVVLDPISFEVESALAYEVGRVRLSVNNAGARVEQVGRYVVIWKRIGDAWRVHHDMFAIDAI